MIRTAFTFILLATFATLVNAQQDQTRNFFPGDAPSLGKAVKDSANNLYKGTQQTAHQTINAAKTTANETRGNWTRFLQPGEPKSETLIDRWNQGTKEFLSKTKDALSPPAIDKPLINLPTFDGGRGLFSNVKLPSLTPASGKKKRSLLPSIFSRQPAAPPKPQTVQDWMGQDRPE